MSNKTSGSRGHYGDGTIYPTKDGRYRVEIQTGETRNGRPVRKVLYGKTKAEANAKRRAAVAALSRGELVAGAVPTLEAWLRWWLENTPETRIRKKTKEGYESKIRTWVHGQPIAKKRLDKITPTDLAGVYTRMRAAGRSETTVAQLHSILRRGLTVAVQHDKISRNPAARMDSPTPSEYTPTVYEMDQARQLIKLAETLPVEQGARWILALAIGPRQAERLGLARSDYNPDTKELTFRRSIVRLTWQHGCGKTDNNPGCGRVRGGSCPQRHSGGIHVNKLKSEAGARTVRLPDPVATALDQLLEYNDAVKIEEGPRWAPWTTPDGQVIELLFSQRNGQPIDHAKDWAAWKAFLASAGVPTSRQHDARHTAATVLLLMGVDRRVVMEILGWSQMSMLRRYQHVLDEMKAAAASKVHEALWATDAPAPAPTNTPAQSNIIAVDFAKRRAL